MSRIEETAELVWETRVPLLSNPFFLYDALKGVVIAGGLFLGLLGLMCAVLGDFEPVGAVAKAMGLALPVILALLALVCLVIFPRGFPARFQVGPRGVEWNFRISRRGAATAHPLSPAAVNATGKLAWREVKGVHLHSGRRVVCLRNGWRVVVRLYCLPENYAAVSAIVERKVNLGP